MQFHKATVLTLIFASLAICADSAKPPKHLPEKLPQPTSRDELKKNFAPGATPTAENFAQLIDSFVHRDDHYISDLNKRIDTLEKSLADLQAKVKALEKTGDERTRR